MPIRLRTTAVVVTALILAGVLVAAGDATTVVSVVDAEQVERGAAVYRAECAICHGAALEGLAHFPALEGPTFRSRWSDRDLDALYVYTHDLMPLGAGGTLATEAYADVTAFVLFRNGVETGDRAFDPEDEQQRAVALADLW